MDDMNREDDLPPALAKALASLDARAGRTARQVHVERVATNVLRRLAAEPAAPRTVWDMGAGRALRVAAAVALLLTGGTLTLTLLQPDDAPAPATTCAMPSCLRGLTAAQSDSLLRSLDEVRVLNGTPRSSSALVEDLDAQELRALLQEMQNTEEASL
jgi:hypothetical protein